MRRDPSSSPSRFAPANKRGLWECSECGHFNDPIEDRCPWCDQKQNEDEE